MNNQITKLLSKKSKIELQVIAKNIGIKGYYKLSKNKLLRKILKSNKNKELKKILNTENKPFYKNWLFTVILIPIVMGLAFFYYGSIQTENQIIESNYIYLENKEYSEYMNQIEKLQNNLLVNFFEGGHKVFGVRNDELITYIKYKGNVKKQKYESRIRYNENTGIRHLILKLDKIFLGTNRIENSNCILKLPPLLEVGRAYELNCITNKLFYIMILNNDIINPVYAIGLKTANFNQ